MFNDLNKIWKYLKISYKLKTNVISGVVFFLLGVAAEFLSKGITPLGIIFIFIISMYPGQLLFSFCATGMVLSSSERKNLMVKYPTEINGIFMFLLTTVIVIIRVIEMFLFKENRVEIANGMLAVVFFVVILSLYTAFAYKYFVTAIITFFIAYMVFYIFFVTQSVVLTKQLISFPVGVVLAYVALVFGIAIEYFGFNVAYKKPISKYTQPAELRKMM